MPLAYDNPSRVLRSDVPPIRSLRIRWPSLVVWLAVTACVAASPLPLAAEVAKEAPCKMLNDWLIGIGKQAAEANRTPAPDDKTIIRFAVNQLVNEPSPFHVELSSKTWPGRGAAWVTFEGKKIADINDADVGKLCVKAYARAKSNEPRDVTIKQAFLDTSKGDNVKRLKVVFQVDAAPSDLYSGVDYLFVGVLPDATTHFSYSKEVTVANNRTATFLSWLFVAVAYLFLARVNIQRR